MTDRSRRAGGAGRRFGRVLVVAGLVVLAATTIAVSSFGVASAGGVGGGGQTPLAGDTSGLDGGVSLDPVAECTVSPTTVEPGEPVTVDASASEDADDFQYAKSTDESFGSFTEADRMQFAYSTPGTYRPRVKVWSYPNETSDTATCGTVTVKEATPTTTDRPTTPPTVTETRTPTPTATPTATPAEELSAEWWYTPHKPQTCETISFIAANRDSERNEYEWDVDDDGTFELTGVVAAQAFGVAGNQTVTLRVTGPRGTTAETSKTFSVSRNSASCDGEDRAYGSDSEEGTSFWMVPKNPVPGETVKLVADTSVPAEDLEDVSWDLDGDGEYEATGSVATTTFEGVGTQSVSLQVDRIDGSSVSVDGSVDVEPGTPGDEEDEVEGDTGADPALTDTDSSGEGGLPGDNGSLLGGAADTAREETEKALPVPFSVALFAGLLLLLVVVYAMGRRSG